MTLSRTSRILVGLTLTALAVLVWANLLLPRAPGGIAAEASAARAASDPSLEDVASGQAEGPDAASPPAAAEPAGDGDAGDVRPGPAAIEPSGEDDDPPEDDAPGDGPGGPAELPFLGPDGDAGDDAAAGPPAVPAPRGEAFVGRDATIAEFPFLVTVPPLAVEETEPAAEAVAAGTAERAGGAAPPAVNPFSPVLVDVPAAPPGAPPADAASPAGGPDVPPAPPVETVVAEPVAPRTPAPRPVVPRTTRPPRLAEALAGAPLSIAPEPLREARAEPASRAPVVVPEIAIREPPTERPARAPVPVPSAGGFGGADASALEPLAPGEVPAAGRATSPLVAGTDPVGRYLRDRDVTFTGSVLGSVGVGVFRVASIDAPVVLTLGQTLPDSEIVLTDLRGQMAEFTLGDTSHVLTLDPRR